jgi:outer membrane protein OmpA-like peptidoglycan-associated protein
MKTGIIAIAAAALISNTGFAASKKDQDKSFSKEEGIGIGSGAAIGAIAGGPFGLVAGLIFGDWLGDKFHDERSEKEVYMARYEETEKLAGKLRKLVADNEDEIQQMHLVLNEQEDSYLDALQQAMAIEVYFPTAESTLDDSVAERVEKLGKLMRKFDDFAVVVEGEETYNDELSAARAAAVRDALIRAGLPSEKITTRAAGERDSIAAEGDLDAMALERRVNLSIVYPIPRENRVAQE